MVLRVLGEGLASFFVFVDWIIGSGSVIGLVRMYGYQNGVTNVFDVPREKG